MSSDILESVRNEILKEDEKALPWVPKNLDQTWETQAGIAAALAGAAAGFALGAHMGLAGPWGAIAGTIPMTIAGGVVGYFTGAKVGSKVQRDWSGFGSGSGTDSARRIADASSEERSQPVKPLQTIKSTQVIQSTSQNTTHCSKCTAAKSSWWDTKKNACGLCGWQPDQQSIPLQSDNSTNSPQTELYGSIQCLSCGARKSMYWNTVRGYCQKCGWKPDSVVESTAQSDSTAKSWCKNCRMFHSVKVGANCPVCNTITTLWRVV